MLNRITDPHTAMSERLQAAFGLRRAESIKIRPERADRGDTLALKDTRTKGAALARSLFATLGSARYWMKQSHWPAGAASFRRSEAMWINCVVSNTSAQRQASIASTALSRVPRIAA